MNEQQTKEPTKNRKENEMKRKNDPRHFHFIRSIFFLSLSLSIVIYSKTFNSKSTKCGNNDENVLKKSETC